MTEQRKTLEALTLEQWTSPVILVTHDGTKAVKIKAVQKYNLITSKGNVHKIDVAFALTETAANALGENLRINKTLAAKKMRTHRNPKKRKPVKGKQPMKDLVDKTLKITFLTGHVLIGTPEEYNQYNFTMKVNDQQVLVYRHALHTIEVIANRTTTQKE